MAEKWYIADATRMRGPLAWRDPDGTHTVECGCRDCGVAWSWTGVEERALTHASAMAKAIFAAHPCLKIQAAEEN